MTHINEGSEEYKKFFASALKKFGVKSPTDLDDDKKREFFNYVDKNWKAKDEVKESDFGAKIDAYQKGLGALNSYASTLETLGLKKKGKVVLKSSKMIQRSLVKRLKEFKASDLDEVNERKIYEVGSPLNSYLSHALNDVGHLLDVAKDKEHGPDAYESWKKSAKLLVAATKLLRKVK
jgi:hypothetical protein